MADLLQGLNDAQREAMTSTDGFILAPVRPGLSHRFAFMVNELGILPGSILYDLKVRQRIHRLTRGN